MFSNLQNGCGGLFMCNSCVVFNFDREISGEVAPECKIISVATAPINATNKPMPVFFKSECNPSMSSFTAALDAQ